MVKEHQVYIVIVIGMLITIAFTYYFARFVTEGYEKDRRQRSMMLYNSGVLDIPAVNRHLDSMGVKERINPPNDINGHASAAWKVIDKQLVQTTHPYMHVLLPLPVLVWSLTANIMLVGLVRSRQREGTEVTGEKPTE